MEKVKIRDFEVVSKYKEEFEAGNIRMPRRSTKKSAGYDIYNNTGEDIVIPPNTTTKAITTKLKAYMLYDEQLELVVRSSLGFKSDSRLSNTVGKIDCDYYNNSKNEGEIFVKIRNPSSETVVIPVGEAMVQGTFSKYLITDSDDETVGGERVGGIGSTSGT